MTTATDTMISNDDKANLVYNQLSVLFEDKSFPSLVILDGAWGSGKTYFYHNRLKSLFTKERPPTFMSVVGLSNRDDFINRLLTSSIGADSDKSNTFASIVNTVTTGLSKTGDNTAGVASAVLSGLSGTIKEAAINKIQNKMFVIDDLERLSDAALKQQIIGECYILAERNNVEFLFLTDISRLELDGSVKEKYFSGSVNFSISLTDIFDIAFSNSVFKDYDDEIREFLQKFNLTNLRVLKRLAFRLLKIHANLVKLPGAIHINNTFKQVLQDSFAITFFSNSHKKTSREIVALFHSANFGVDSGQSKEEEMLIGHLSYRNNPSVELIELLCFERHTLNDIENYVRVYEENPVDDFIFNVFHIQDDDTFNRLLPAFETFIFANDKCFLRQWIEACEIYILLIQWEYIDKDLSIVFKEIRTTAGKRTYEIEEDRTMTMDVRNKELLEIKSNIITRIGATSSQNWQNVMETHLITSWLKFEKKLNTDFSTPQLHLFSKKKWSDAINAWDAGNVMLFGTFVAQRYLHEPSQKLLSAEKPIIRHVLSEVSKKISNGSVPYGVLRGSFTRLKRVLEKASAL